MFIPKTVFDCASHDEGGIAMANAIAPWVAGLRWKGESNFLSWVLE